ncbi:hypothetical protein CJ030_MR2G022155 [Morella rubra]|uniref:Uncharacterized protein n=1 Tax=Morella rubra TaxID=262757 RepID=A0A6A1WED3_9ROSI|nr:hypothetical protein CJ030_MR2G022155 [Morella rubra]
MSSPPVLPSTSPTSVINLTSPPSSPIIAPLSDFPFSPLNSPQSPDTEAHEFAMSGLEPLGFDESSQAVMTSDLIDSLESPAIPPSGFGPTLEDYLAAHASSRSGKAQFTLDPCPKDLPSRAVSGLSPPVPSLHLFLFKLQFQWTSTSALRVRKKYKLLSLPRSMFRKCLLHVPFNRLLLVDILIKASVPFV